jgi:hypothetical protein
VRPSVISAITHASSWPAAPGVNVAAPHLITHLLSEADLIIMSILLPRGTYRASVMGEPPVGATWVSAGSVFSASLAARSSSASDPNGHLDLAPDRRLADLELSGADRAALAQCAEFGQ